MNRNRHATFVAFGKVLAFQHPRHGVTRCELNHAARTAKLRRVTPLRVVANFGFFFVQNQTGLLIVSFRIGFNLLTRERRARGVAPRWIANHRSKITNQENHRVSQVLQLTQFIQHHGVTQMDVRRSRIQAQFNAQRHACRRAAGEFLHPFAFNQQFIATAFAHSKGVFNGVGDGIWYGGGFYLLGHGEHSIYGLENLASC